MGSRPIRSSLKLAQSRPSTELGRIAKDARADAVVVYRVRTEQRQARVYLLVFAVSLQTAHVDDLLIGAAQHTGLVSWNPIFVGTIGIIVGLLLLWLVWRMVRGSGTIRLELKGDPRR